ncbi:hypothetical protein HQ590_04975, partial [bacterium]|nr:hypothetical protein [bacterium]
WAYELTCNRRVLACRSRPALADQLLRQLTCGISPQVGTRVLAPALAAALRDGPPASLAAALADVDEAWPVIDQVSVVYAREYLRRQSVPSLALLRSRVDVRLPFLDPDYVDAILGLRPRLRLGTRVHRHLIGRFNPALLRIINANTGAPAGANDWHQRLSRKKQQWLRRLFHYERYRHYVDVRAWLRGPLKGAAEIVLLDPRTLDRGLCQPDGVRRLWREHQRGRADHGAAILLLVYLELWMRLFADGEPWRPPDRLP